MGERGALVSPIPSPQNTKIGAMERSKRLDFPMWDTPPKPMQFMPLVVCVLEREREREREGSSSTLQLLERKEKEKFTLDHKNLLESKPLGKRYISSIMCGFLLGTTWGT
jgi:hypothetical protein